LTATLSNELASEATLRSPHRGYLAREIVAIRTAMGGVPIRGAATARELNGGTLIRQIVVAAP
jgi:hypothetical protein